MSTRGGCTCAEAADEIERLRERCEAYKGQVFAGSQEIERLTTALREIAGHEPLIGGDGWIMRNRARAALSTSNRHE
jgi:hypothetical protein